jgi:carboxypeptidase C (cathepsin A)
MPIVRVTFFAFIVAAAMPVAAVAQRSPARSSARSAAADTGKIPTAASAPAPAEPESVVTHHSITVGGQRIAYTARVGNIILRDTADEPIGSLFYTSYTMDGVKDATRRPITFAYNGGPGSSSIWVHMGAFGPRRVNIPDTTHTTPPPYDLVDNPYTILDKTDLVFIDPIGTGFSKPIGKGKGKDFWGVDQDARSLAQFVSRYLAQNERWNSPRYLLGESYGTTRSAALVNYLQGRDNMDFNGVILMSAVLDFQTITFDPGNDEPYILYLPSYAAVASYFGALQQKPADLTSFLDEVEHFATNDYATALLAGSKLSPARRDSILDRLQRYTGLSRDYLDKADLRVDPGEFEKELLRGHGEVVGRLDARFTGPTGDLLAQRAPYDPQSAAISSSYTSLFNHYLRTELGFGKDMQYVVSGRVQPGDWTHGQSRGWPGHTNVAVDLAEALQRNTHLQVLLNSGIYDLATPYYAAEYTMDHLGLPKELRDHIQIVEYDAGHMMYVHPESLAKLKSSIVSFIDRTSVASGSAAAVAGGR